MPDECNSVGGKLWDETVTLTKESNKYEWIALETNIAAINILKKLSNI